MLTKYDYSYGATDLATGGVDAAKNNGQLGKVEGWIGGQKQWSQRFGYDELGRLKEAREYKQGDNAQLSYKQVFDFDRFGNLYRKQSSNPTAGQQHPLPFTPIEDSDINRATNRFATGTTYDEAGQVTTDNRFRSMGFAYDAFGKLIAEYGLPSGGTGGVKYIQQDWQGSVRKVTNKGAFVVSRTDHQAFGEEIAAGVGSRTAQQGFGNASGQRQGYALTERDDASGMQHTWFRKLEQRAGRWSSPDPYNGSANRTDPRTFNRYAYVEGDPVNGIDPSGLCTVVDGRYLGPDCWVNISWSGGGISGMGGGVGGSIGNRGDDQSKCAGGSCGGGGSASSTPGGPGQERNDEEESQQKRAEACARAKIRRARQQAIKDAIRGQLALSATGFGIWAAMSGGVGGRVGAAFAGAYLSPELRGIGERAINPQIVAAVKDCEMQNPLADLSVGVLTRLALSTTL